MLGLLAGCRSERVTFQLPATQWQPTAPSIPRASQITALAINQISQLCSVQHPGVAARQCIQGHSKAVAVHQFAHYPQTFRAPVFFSLRPPPTAHRLTSAAETARAVLRTGLTWGDVLQGLGTVLAIGGVVLGVQLGGWPQRCSCCYLVPLLAYLACLKMVTSLNQQHS